MTNVNEIRDIVESTDYETLQNFVVNLLSEDENLVMRLRLLSNNELTEEDFDQYKKRYQEIVRPNVERGSFVPYFKARRMERGLNDFLENDVAGLVDNNYFEEAFNITKLIFLRLNKLAIDDSDGTVSSIMNEIFRVWQEILNHGPKTISTTVFRWVVSRHDNLSDNIDAEKYLEFLLNNFKEQNQMERKLQIAGQQIDALENDTNPGSFSWKLEMWSKFYLNLALQMDRPEREIDAFIEKYLYLFEVRDIAIERHISKSEYDKAIELLKEGRAIDFKPHGLNRWYTIQLKELYKLNRNREACLEELWLLQTKYDHTNIEYLDELREHYNEEDWLEIREELFEALPDQSRLGMFYKREGMYDRLLEHVQNSMSARELETYENDLKDKYPVELLDMYEKIALLNMKHANERSMYRDVVKFTRNMFEYPDGRERVDKLVEYWKDQHKNRPAMFDELEKLK
ncbi:hypothetical protein [Salinicoccus sp. Marseille-QA3877]